MKLEANIDAVILWQSVQLQMKLSTNPGASVGNFNCTAPQKQVAVASVEEDQPSSASPARGMYGLDLSAVLRDIFCCEGVWEVRSWRRDKVVEAWDWVTRFETWMMGSYCD